MPGTLLAFTPNVAEKVAAYCEEHSTPLPADIEQHKKFTNENFHDAFKMITSLAAQLFIFLAKDRCAKRILEIGCYSGYSALAWAHALKGVEGAEIITLEIDPKMIAVALAAFEKYKVTDRVKLIEGPAAETMQTVIHGEFDIIFIDADKEGYKNYVEIILRRGLLSKTGLIIADNVLVQGLVVDKSYQQTSRYPNPAAVREFNDYVLNEPRLEVVILPLFDGLGLIRLKD